MEGVTYEAAQLPERQKQPTSTPPTTSNPSSRKSSPSRHNAQSLSLDLSDLPPLITPSPPSNTLLITNLLDSSIFHPASLATIRENISRTAALHSFSPLKSFRRIVVSFYTADGAIAVRQQLDGTALLGTRIRVFFGAPTPVNVSERERHLAAPEAQKLFFISPPPSPPHGWEMRNEDPPNKNVHADDLSVALAKLHARTGGAHDTVAEKEDGTAMPVSPVSPVRTEGEAGVGAGAAAVQAAQSNPAPGRMRSGSTTVVYHPEDHGHSPTLPAVMVEDTTYEEGQQGMDNVEEEEEEEEKKIMAHTARPPVELMEQS